MYQQPKTDHEWNKSPNNSSCKALIKKSDYDKSQENVHYFLDMFYSKTQNDEHDGGKQKLYEVQKMYKNVRNISIVGCNQYDKKQNLLSIQLSYLVIIIVMCILVIFVYFDMKSEYASQLTNQKLHLTQCIKEYHQNECENPVQILQQQCKKLKHCYHEQPIAKVKFTVVFAKVITNMIRTIVEDLGMLGVAVLLLVTLIYLWRPAKGNTHQLNNLNNQNHVIKIQRD